MKFSHEPLLYIGVIDTILILITTFGIPISVEQKTAVDGVLAAGALLFARSQVTPVAKLKDAGIIE